MFLCQHFPVLTRAGVGNTWWDVGSQWPKERKPGFHSLLNFILSHYLLAPAATFRFLGLPHITNSNKTTHCRVYIIDERTQAF